MPAASSPRPPRRSAPRASTSWCATTSPAASSSAARSSRNRCRSHGGSIVNMTADYRNGFPNMVHTGAARAGMANLTMTLAYEWAVPGVRVNSVAPGWIASSGMDTYTGEFKEQHPQAQELLPARPPRHRERGVRRGLLPAERRRRPTSPAPRSASTAACRSATARSTCRPPTSRRPSTASISPRRPKCWAAERMPILESQVDRNSDEFKRNRERMLGGDRRSSATPRRACRRPPRSRASASPSASS